VFLGGPPWWEAMVGGEGGDVRPNHEDEKCGGRDSAQNDVELRNVGGGKEGRGSVPTTVTGGGGEISFINCFYQGKWTHVLNPTVLGTTGIRPE